MFDGKVCERKGSHYCEPRADRVVAFFAELLVHTKGPYARRAFVPSVWQEWEILRPLFGEVVWSAEWRRYVRRYRVATIVLARKNGKSELAAGIILYLLVGDDEEAAEVYGAAKDTKQAGKVFEPAWRMVQLSPTLRRRLKHNKHSRRIYDEQSASYYEIITADALGELGHNPHGFVLDEALSQPDDTLWTAMRTAAGARAQPLLLLITTETSDGESFGAHMIDEAVRVQESPRRAPHQFAFVRRTPHDADPWDERVWPAANPALGDFLSKQALREEALEVRNDPRKENAFRQFRLNQRVSQSTRFVQMGLWDACAGRVWTRADYQLADLDGLACTAGLDLSAKLDLTAWCVVFDDGRVWWRHWLPDEVLPVLDKATDGAASMWVRAGWLTVTDGNVIDYEQVIADITADAERFRIRSVDYDRWSGEPVRQRIETATGVAMVESATSYDKMTLPLKTLEERLKARDLEHFANPLVRWQAEAMEVKRPRDDADRMRPVKPARTANTVRIDGMVALLLALAGRTRVVEALELEGSLMA